MVDFFVPRPSNLPSGRFRAEASDSGMRTKLQKIIQATGNGRANPRDFKSAVFKKDGINGYLPEDEKWPGSVDYIRKQRGCQSAMTGLGWMITRGNYLLTSAACSLIIGWNPFLL